MAKRTNLRLFLGTDQAYAVTILTTSGSAAIDVTGWATSFMIKRWVEDLDGQALLTTSAIATTGVYNSDPDVNTQLLTVTLSDTDTSSLDPGAAVWELKRTDDGAEAVLAYGTMTLQRGVHRA